MPLTLAVGNGLTVTVAKPVIVFSQRVVLFFTLTNVTVLLAVFDAANVALPEPSNVMVVFAPPSKL